MFFADTARVLSRYVDAIMMRTNDPVDEYARVYFDRDHAEMGEALLAGKGTNNRRSRSACCP